MEFSNNLDSNGFTLQSGIWRKSAKEVEKLTQNEISNELTYLSKSKELNEIQIQRTVDIFLRLATLTGEYSNNFSSEIYTAINLLSSKDNIKIAFNSYQDNIKPFFFHYLRIFRETFPNLTNEPSSSEKLKQCQKELEYYQNDFIEATTRQMNELEAIIVCLEKESNNNPLIKKLLTQRNNLQNLLSKEASHSQVSNHNNSDHNVNNSNPSRSSDKEQETLNSLEQKLCDLLNLFEGARFTPLRCSTVEQQKSRLMTLISNLEQRLSSGLKGGKRINNELKESGVKINTLTKENKNFEWEIKTFKNKVEELKRSKTSLQKQLIELTRNADEIEEKIQRNFKNQNIYGNSKPLRDDHANQLYEKSKIMNQINEVNKQLEAANQELKKEEEQQATVSNSDDSGILKILKQLKDELAVTQVERNNFRKEAEEARKLKGMEQPKGCDFENWNDTFTAYMHLCEEIEDRKSKMKAFEDQIATLMDMPSQSEENIIDLSQEDKSANLLKALTALKQQLEDSGSAVEVERKIQAAITSVKNEIGAAQEEATLLQATVANLTVESNEYSHELEATRKRQTELKETLGYLEHLSRGNIEPFKEKIKNLNAQLQSTELAKQEIVRELGRKEEVNRMLESQLEDAQAVNEELQKALTDVRVDLKNQKERLEAKISDLQQQVSSEAEVKQLRSTLSELVRIEQLAQQLDDMQYREGQKNNEQKAQQIIDSLRAASANNYSIEVLVNKVIDLHHLSINGLKFEKQLQVLEENNHEIMEKNRLLANQYTSTQVTLAQKIKEVSVQQLQISELNQTLRDLKLSISRLTSRLRNVIEDNSLEAELRETENDSEVDPYSFSELENLVNALLEQKDDRSSEASLKGQLAQIETIVKDFKKLERQSEENDKSNLLKIKALTKEIEALQNSLQEKIDCIEEFNHQSLADKKKIESKDRQITLLKEANSKLESSIDELRSQMLESPNIEGVNGISKAQDSSLQNELKTAVENLETAYVKIDDLQKQQQKQTRKIEELEKGNDQLREIERAAYEQLNRNSKLQDELAQKDQFLEVARLHIIEQSTRIDEQAAEIERLRALLLQNNISDKNVA